jgi:hypothetical protein
MPTGVSRCTSWYMTKKRVVIVVAAMGFAAFAACVSRLQTPQRSQAQGSQAQGSEVQGTQVHGTAVAPLHPEGVRVVGGRLVTP